MGGVWLDTVAPVGDVEDSTIWRTDGGYCGNYEASCTFGAPPDFSAPWLRQGALYEHVEGGVVTFDGFLGEPEQGDVWRLNAFGWGADAINYRSTERHGMYVNDNIDAATSRGMGFTRRSDFDGTWDGTDEALMMSLAEVLDKAAKAKGGVWWVANRDLIFRQESSTVSWVMSPNSAYLGTTDEEVITSLAGLYWSAQDVDGNPIAVSLTSPVSDAVAAEKFRPHERTIDMRSLGYIQTQFDAEQIVSARFAQVGARAGWTNGFEMTSLNSGRASNGIPAPMAVRAGDRVRIPGVTDMRSGVTYLASVEVTAGRVRRLHAEQRAVVEPVGMAPRDLSSVLTVSAPARSSVEVL